MGLCTLNEVAQLRNEVKSLRQLSIAKLVDLVDGDMWMRLEAFCTLTGWKETQVREYRNNGTWPDGIITEVRGRRIHVNFPAYNRWVRTGRAA